MKKGFKLKASRKANADFSKHEGEATREEKKM